MFACIVGILYLYSYPVVRRRRRQLVRVNDGGVVQ